MEGYYKTEKFFCFCPKNRKFFRKTPQNTTK